MIALLNGIITQKFDDHVILEVNDVGYEVYFSQFKMSSLPINEKLSIHIYTHVREDVFQLFGFVTIHEKKMFKLLLNISGIGPKMAMLITGAMDLNTLISSIRMGNIRALTSVPGIGGKTAERVILELKNKKELDLLLDDTTQEVQPLKLKHKTSVEQESSQNITNQQFNDAINALQALGFKDTDAAGAVRNIINNDSASDVSQIVKLALRLLSQNG